MFRFAFPSGGGGILVCSSPLGGMAVLTLYQFWPYLFSVPYSMKLTLTLTLLPLFGVVHVLVHA